MIVRLIITLKSTATAYALAYMTLHRLKSLGGVTHNIVRGGRVSYADSDGYTYWPMFTWLMADAC